LFRIYALPEPKDFVTPPCDHRHGKLLSRRELKIDTELHFALGTANGHRAEVHIAAHWLQSTASLFHSIVKNPPRNQAGWSWKADK
jgi:hypothetical protein